MKLSNCCGAEVYSSWVYYNVYGEDHTCPDCKEPCEFIEICDECCEENCVCDENREPAKIFNINNHE